MTVIVRTVGLLRSLFGSGRLEVDLAEGATVADLLAALADTYGEQVATHFREPEAPQAYPPLRLMVNGRDVAVLDGRQTVLRAGDDVLVLTPMAGG